MLVSKVLGKGLMANAIGGAIDGGLEYWSRRTQHPDESRLKSMAYAGVSWGLWNFFPSLMWAKVFYQISKGVAPAMVQMGQQYATMKNSAFGNTGYIGRGFMDTALTATARQRGLMAIEQSRLNLRSALGNEARSLHR